jgi:hypothetical protein
LTWQALSKMSLKPPMQSWTCPFKLIITKGLMNVKPVLNQFMPKLKL